MTQFAIIRRWLKVADPTAITTLETLRRALQFGRRVRHVDRSELFCVAWETPPRNAAAVLEGLAIETTLISNPNKHRVEVAVADERLNPRGNAWVLVFEPGDGVALQASIRRMRLLADPPSWIRRAALWELDLEGTPAEIADAAAAMAVTRSRTEGLLANPHYQHAEVYTEPPTASTVVARVMADQPTEVSG